jgi:N-acetylmuramoyl-L-alanine amidase
MKIALTVGHSILKSGAITSADSTRFGGGNEYKFNKTFSTYLAKALRKNGHSVDVIICPEKKLTKLTQEKNYKLDIVNDEENAYNLIIELHLNSSDNSSAKGTEVLYLSNKGKAYAKRVQANLSKVFEDRGIKLRTNLYMLSQTKPVCIMPETYFCTNKKEWHYARLHKGYLAKLISDGIDSKKPHYL